MDRKIVFMDIDGTLYNDDIRIPELNLYACKKALENGHRLYLSTGRSKPEIFDELLELNCHGIIGAGGAYIEVDNEVLLHKQVSLEECKHAVDFFAKHKIPYFLESNGGLYASDGCIERMGEFWHKGVSLLELERMYKSGEIHPFIKMLKTGEKNMYRSDVNKICFFDNGITPFEVIEEEFKNEYGVVRSTVALFGPNSGELTVFGINKGTAVLEVLKHTGDDIKNTIAIGDGGNDIEMVELCNVGIAVANANPALIEVADYVTKSNNDAGVYHAFKEFGLID